MTEESRGRSGVGLSASKAAVAVVVGLIGAALIWWLTPYNNFLWTNQPIADYYLPVGALFLILLLVLVANPLLKLLGLRLGFRQLAIVLAVMLVASSVVSSGLHRYLPYMLAQYVVYTNTWRDIADRMDQTDVPDSLYPGEMTYKGEYDAADNFLKKVREGEEIPWDAWTGPAVSWLLMMLPWWIMLLGMASVVLPQWRRNERLSFPLVRIQQQIIETPSDGHVLPALFRTKGFWIALAVVLLIYFLQGLGAYWPGRVPAIPTAWNLSGLFADEPLNKMPGYVRGLRVYFLFLGIAYFMTSRLGFSIWFFMIFYAFYAMIGSVFAPPFHADDMAEAHRSGAMLVVALSILWLGRAHWLRVGRLLFFGESTSGLAEEVGGPTNTKRGPSLAIASVLMVLLSAALAIALGSAPEVLPDFNTGQILLGLLFSTAAGVTASLLFTPLRPEGLWEDRRLGGAVAALAVVLLLLAVASGLGLPSVLFAAVTALGVSLLTANIVSGDNPWRFVFIVLTLAGAALLSVLAGWLLHSLFGERLPSRFSAASIMAFCFAALLAGALIGCMFRRLDDDVDRRDRMAGFALLIGAVGLTAWFVWAGVQPGWAVLLVVLGFGYGLLVTRVVAETGLPYFAFPIDQFWHVFSRFPITWVNNASAYFVGWFGVLASDTSQMSVAVLATHAESLDEEASPRHHWRLASLFLVVLVIGFVAAGGVHLYMNYNHSRTVDYTPEQPINTAGAGKYFPGLTGLLQTIDRGTWDEPTMFDQPQQIMLGAGAAAFLQWACLSMPKFPLHPIGMLVAWTSFSEAIWFSIFFGWLLRVLLVSFGGARLYANARPVFMGFIIGELLAAALWVLISIPVYLAGLDLHPVSFLP